MATPGGALSTAVALVHCEVPGGQLCGGCVTSQHTKHTSASTHCQHTGLTRPGSRSTQCCRQCRALQSPASSWRIAQDRRRRHQRHRRWQGMCRCASGRLCHRQLPHWLAPAPHHATESASSLSQCLHTVTKTATVQVRSPQVRLGSGCHSVRSQTSRRHRGGRWQRTTSMCVAVLRLAEDWAVVCIASSDAPGASTSAAITWLGAGRPSTPLRHLAGLWVCRQSVRYSGVSAERGDGVARALCCSPQLSPQTSKSSKSPHSSPSLSRGMTTLR